MEDNQLAGLVRTLKIICGALIFAVTGFALFTLLTANWKEINLELSPLGLIAILVAISSSIAAFVFPKFLIKQAATEFVKKNPKPELRSLLGASGQAITSSFIVSMAIAEGAAFFSTLVWFISNNALGLIGLPICLAAMIVKFPTYGKVEQGMADFREEVKLQQRGS